MYIISKQFDAGWFRFWVIIRFITKMTQKIQKCLIIQCTQSTTRYN